MSKQIDENSGWIKENLVKIWGENRAEYFSNPAILVNKPDESMNDGSGGGGNGGGGGGGGTAGVDRLKSISNAVDSKRKSSKQPSTATAASTSQNKGLYAFTIWENIREDTKKKLRHFNLEKELQVSCLLAEANKLI